MTKHTRRSMLAAAAATLLIGAWPRAQNQVVLSTYQKPEPTITGAPYSAEGVTTVKATMFDGTKIERSVTAKFYRDSAGRVRREQTVVGLLDLDPANDFRAVVTIVDPVARTIITLNPATRTAHRLSFDMALGDKVPQNIRIHREQLGTKDIDGFAATGSRDTKTIPAGQIGNDRPIQITDETWESTELKVVLFSRHSDPRTGDVEFKLLKISRQEPAKDLFTVPAGYKILESTPGTIVNKRS